jgi:hypothetical protein
MIVSWFSAGVSSFIAAYLVRDKLDKIIYIDIEDQHPDSMRFLQDCSYAIGKEIEILQSPYKSVSNVVLTVGYINGVHGATCTNILKKRVRKQWEREHKDIELTYVWGFDAAEKHRADRLLETMPKQNHLFPLIEQNFAKENAHGLLKKLGIKRPAMYDMGYSNNNCIGCVKGGMGYWNKIRIDFPDVFAERARQERVIGASCFNGIYLDELDPARGRMEDEIMEECGFICEWANV